MKKFNIFDWSEYNHQLALLAFNKFKFELFIGIIIMVFFSIII